MKQRSNPEIDEVIANGRKLAKEAEALLEKVATFFAERNITAESALDDVRARGGEAAVEKVIALVEAEKQNIEDEMRQKRLYLAKTRAPGRRVNTRMKV